jgi:phosphatidylethanolamine/phosphatidyl-N-methylethanolamine N-methyltransferase
MTQLQSTTTQPERSAFRDSMRFVRQFLTSPGSVGAILPSSRYLAYTMVRDLHLERGDVVVEYGPGTGPMTQALQKLELRQRGIRYLGIELDPKFHHALSHRFTEMDFHLGSVEDIETILAERQLGKPKAIISSLPFASLPHAVQSNVVEGTYNVLRDDGEFRTFQYVLAYKLKSARRFRAMMEERFDGFSRSQPVLRNVPPAYVLSYSKSRRDDVVAE